MWNSWIIWELYFQIFWATSTLSSTETILFYIPIQQCTRELVPPYTSQHLLFSGFAFVYPRGSEKAMAPHSSTLAWKISWMEEPGKLQSMGSQRVEHDWATSLSLFTFMLWRRKWQPTPVFLPGESQGLGSLVGCRLWDRTESDTTEVT